MRYVLIAQQGANSFEMHEQINRFGDSSRNDAYVFYQSGKDVLTIDDNVHNSPVTIRLKNNQVHSRTKDDSKIDTLTYRYLLTTLAQKLKPGDQVVCDTIMRIGDDAGKVYWVYREFLKKRVDLRFLDEPVVDSEHFTNMISSFDEDQLAEVQKMLVDVYKMRSADLIADKTDAFKKTAIEEYLPKYTNKNKAIAMPVIKEMHKDFGGYMTSGVLRQYLLDKYGIDVPPSTLRRYISEAKNSK